MNFRADFLDHRDGGVDAKRFVVYMEIDLNEIFPTPFLFVYGCLPTYDISSNVLGEPRLGNSRLRKREGLPEGRIHCLNIFYEGRAVLRVLCVYKHYSVIYEVFGT